MGNDAPEHRLNSLIETVYFATSQPVTVELLQSMYQIFGHQHTLKERCEEFGCRSLIELIRKYSERFKPFLEIYTCLDGKLYYFNKHIRKTDMILDDAKDKVMLPPYARVFFEDTIYFEKQNQEEYLAGRAEFAKLVHECEKAGIVDRDCLVPLSRIHKRMEERFPGRKPTEVIKEWFQTKHLEAIMEEILFDDIDCFLSGNRKECRFRMKPGMTLEEVLTNIENIRNGHKEFKKKRDAVLYLHNRPSFSQPDQHQKRNNQHYSRITREPVRHRGDKPLSESEDDDRVENAAYSLAHRNVKRRLRPQVDVNVADDNEETKPSVPSNHRSRIKNFAYFEINYGLKEDVNVDEVLINALAVMPDDSFNDDDDANIDESFEAYGSSSSNIQENYEAISMIQESEYPYGFDPILQRPIPLPRRKKINQKDEANQEAVVLQKKAANQDAVVQQKKALGREYKNYVFSDSEDDDRIENAEYSQ